MEYRALLNVLLCAAIVFALQTTQGRVLGAPSDLGVRSQIVAHRGASADAPENTLASIREAIAQGADACEFDVYGTVDGFVFLMHDKELERTTNSVGIAVDMTLSELKRLDAGGWKSPEFAGEPVPMLEESLMVLSDTECRPVIEIKMPGISARVVQAVRNADMVDQCAVIAFDHEVVREVREMEPGLQCAWLTDGKSLPSKDDAELNAAYLGERLAACGADTIDMHHEQLTQELVEQLHEIGVAVWIYTANDEETIQRLSDWGVDAITTDHPAMGLRVVKPEQE
jgi:glycerophosphoryl diester phosphodiesterase